MKKKNKDVALELIQAEGGHGIENLTNALAAKLDEHREYEQRLLDALTAARDYVHGTMCVDKDIKECRDATAALSEEGP